MHARKGDPMVPDDPGPDDDQTRSGLGTTSAYSDHGGSDHDLTGSHRDQDAADRDQAASDQDQAASDRDLAHGVGRDGYARSRAVRDHSTRARQGTSRERHHTAHLRDRDRAFATERNAAGVGNPTGTERRGPGLAAVQREIERARRQKGLLVVAYVDFGCLHANNNSDDQGIEDGRGKQLVGVMKAHLRPDELIVRLGGDEFLCALPGATIKNVGRRVEELAGQLTASPDASPVNMGLAELVRDDDATELVDRAHADADLLAARREDRCEQQ